MAFSEDFSGDLFPGRGAAAYPVRFPFLSAEHIWAAVAQPAGNAAVRLDRSQFTVRRTLDPSGQPTEAFEVATTVAYPSTAQVGVFREIVFDQPFEFPEAGALSQREIERALDRVVMQIQQLWRYVTEGSGGTLSFLPGSGSSILSLALWGTALLRSQTKPSYAGQLGVQLSDKSLWISNTAALGDWSEFAPQGAAVARRLTLSFVADVGAVGTHQTVVGDLLRAWRADGELDGVIFGGDNNYAGEPGFEAAWVEFEGLVDDEIAYPALGNHDIDGPTTWANHVAKFSYLPGNKRYYKKTLGAGLVDLFVLHSGLNTARVLVEPDGNAVGSVQHQWFVGQLATSTARWKLVVVHHPPVSCLENVSHAALAMDWPEFAGVDGVLCGHGHTSEYLLLRGVPIINGSAAVQGRTGTPHRPWGPLGAKTLALFADSSRRLVVRLIIERETCVVQFIDTLNGSVRFQRDLRDKSLHPAVWDGRPFYPSDPLADGHHYSAGRLMRAMECTEVRVTCDQTSMHGVHVRLHVRGVPFADLEIPPYWETVTLPVKQTFPQGADITAEIIGGTAPYGDQVFGLSVGLLGRWVS